MSLEALFAFFVTIVVFGLTPGPVVFATLARCMARGFWSGVEFNVGVVVSDIVFLLAAIYGLSAIASAMGEVFFVVKWIGAAYLVWLGIQLWRAEPVPVEEIEIDHAARRAALRRDAGSAMLSGFLVGIGNPKGILFYGAFLPTFIDIQAVTTTDVVWLSLIIVVALMLVNNGYGFLAARARRWFRSRRAMQRLNRTSGTVMIGAGVLVATR
jgi:threonine/homoserine/homoserine lactone efflux protein